MKQYIYILTLLFFHSFVSFAETSLKDLLSELDGILANGSYYMEQKEHRINRHKIQLQQEVSPERQYELGYRIIDEYKSYMSDSALVYIRKNFELADTYANNSWFVATKLQSIFVLASSGLFLEAESLLNSIKKESLTNEQLVEYYKCFELLYTNINIYQDQKQLIRDYIQLVRSYRQSILESLSPDNPERYFYQHLLAEMDSDYVKAEEYLVAYLNVLHPGTHEHAKKSYSMAMLYEKMGKKDEQVIYLIQAVASDVKDAIKENRALLDLSIWLYEYNDVERAFNYILYSLNDANFYNARFRYFEISKILPIITTAYQNKNQEQSSRMKSTLFVISVLFVVLLIMMLFLNKQMQALKRTRKSLKEVNGHLETMNSKLNMLNQELSEASHIKEEYIGHFLDLCSEYIGNLQDLKRTIKNKIAAKQFDELLRMTSSDERTDEMKNLYTNFDKAFLNIYPGFVDSVNEYLKEEYRFQIKKSDLLNTELRVLALIRLGINDPTKIASFLRCSVQTIYNYRSKIRRNSINEAEDIEEQIKKIGKLNIC